MGYAITQPLDLTGVAQSSEVAAVNAKLAPGVTPAVSAVGQSAGVQSGLEELMQRLTAVRAALIDNVNATVSSRLASNSNPPNADVATSTRASSTATTRINTVQRGTITVTGTSQTATITSVDTTKTQLANLGFTGDQAEGRGMRIVLTDATTITAVIGSAPGGIGNIVGYEVTAWT